MVHNIKYCIANTTSHFCLVSGKLSFGYGVPNRHDERNVVLYERLRPHCIQDRRGPYSLRHETRWPGVGSAIVSA